MRTPPGKKDIFHMPFIISKLSQEPIVLVQIDLASHEDASCASLQAQLDRIASDITPLVMVLDLRDQEIRFCDMLLFLADCEANPKGTAADPRIRTILLSNHPMLPVMRQRFQQRLKISIHQACTMDEALRIARTTLVTTSPGIVNDSLISS